MSEPARQPAWGVEKVEAPSAFASVTSLGRYQQAWKPSGSRVRGAWPILIIGVILLGVGITMALSTGQPVAFVPFGLFGIIFLPIGVIMMIQSGTAASQAALYGEGFAALVGSKVSLWPWDEIASITFKDQFVSGKRASWTDHRCQVANQNGETVLVSSDLEDVTGLIDAIKAHVTPKLLPALQTAYDAGQPLTFGSITVSRNVIEGPGRRFDWTAVRNVVMKNGWLVVTPKEGKPFEMRTEKIPNVDLLCQLIGVKYTRFDLAYYFGAPR